VPATKKCIRCEKTKPLEKFSRQSAVPDGRQSYCKECSADYIRARRSPPQVLSAKECATCGERFIPAQRSQIYHSKKCKVKALYWRRHPSKEDNRCQACGKNISHMRSNAKWCDEACARLGHRENHKAIVRRSRLKTQYGLTPETYDALLERQGGGCAICGSDEIRGYGKRLAVDHCHDTNRVRGILCGKCNRGLGAFDHDPALLRAAAKYVN
jgi:hypothetical protein